MMRTKTTKALFGLILLQLSTSVFAKCMRTPNTSNVYWPTDWPPVDTDAGIVKPWVGAQSGGGLNMGKVNLLSDLIQPVGETIANGGPVPLTQFGNYSGFDPEQILFVCTPDEEPYLYEGFILTDSDYQGNTVTDPRVPEHTNTTFVKRIGFRALHVDTGKYFTNKWQLKKMDGLDRDKYGRLLVKAKNFSAVQLEYVKIASPTPVVRSNGTTLNYIAPNLGDFGYFDAFGWTFLVSHHPDNAYNNQIPNCREGQISAYQCSSWPYREWVPGTLSNTHAHLGGSGGGGFTSYKGCIFSQVTPSVVFDSISASELEAGEYRSGKIEVIYECENEAKFGTGAGSNAIGFKVNNFAKSVAEHFGQLTSGNGVKKLFSDAYFQDDFAKGVGIELFSSGSQTPMNWLTIDSGKGNGNVDGWYGITGDRLNSDSDPIGIYRAEYDVKLSKFSPAVAVSPGKVIAIAEVVVSVQ
ncbi:fimbrial protein [Vibrio metschnikovii]|uniref:fimbrial protein n=1 Tax=Vibrio metschnikovii TaxID=28172 RepID=UPI002FCA2DF1